MKLIKGCTNKTDMTYRHKLVEADHVVVVAVQSLDDLSHPEPRQWQVGLLEEVMELKG